MSGKEEDGQFTTIRKGIYVDDTPMLNRLRKSNLKPADRSNILRKIYRVIVDEA